MKLFVLLQLLKIIVFASDKYNFVENSKKAPEKMESGTVEQIEEDEYIKINGDSKYIGTIYKESNSKWEAHRWSTNEKKLVYSGYYNDEESAAHASDTLARKLMKNGEQDHKLNFPDDDNEMYTDEETHSSVYIGVSKKKKDKLWCVRRWSKNEKKVFHNGTYEDEETAAHASDTLARKLMTHGEKEHKLNFPDDDTEVYAKQKISKYVGVYYQQTRETWQAQRYSKNEKKNFCNGYYRDEETAARASDTLARKLMRNGENEHKLNFPDDHTEVHREKRTNYIGVYYNEKPATWCAWRWSKKQSKVVYNGTTYKDEKTAAHASDTLARKLISNGEHHHNLNFPDEDTEVTPEKRVNYIGVYHNEKRSTWGALRRSKIEKKMVYNGTYKNERKAAHASDNLAKKLMKNGENGHKLNFPDDNIQVDSKESKCQNKRKRQYKSGNSQKKKYHNTEI